MKIKLITRMKESFIAVVSTIVIVGITGVGLTMVRLFPGRPLSTAPQPRTTSSAVLKKRVNPPFELDYDALLDEIRINVEEYESKKRLREEKKGLLSSSWKQIQLISSHFVYMRDSLEAPLRELAKIETRIDLEYEFRKTEVLSIERLTREIKNLADQQRMLKQAASAAQDALKMYKPRGWRQLSASFSRNTRNMAIDRTRSPSTSDSENLRIGAGDDDSASQS